MRDSVHVLRLVTWPVGQWPWRSVPDTTSICALCNIRSSYGHLNLTTPILKLSRSMGVRGFWEVSILQRAQDDKPGLQIPQIPIWLRIREKSKTSPIHWGHPLSYELFVMRLGPFLRRFCRGGRCHGGCTSSAAVFRWKVCVKRHPHECRYQRLPSRTAHCNRIYRCYLLYQLVLWKVQYVWSHSQAVKNWHQSISVWQAGSETPWMIPLLEFRKRSSDFCVFTCVEWEQHALCFASYRSERLNDTLTAVSSVWVTRKNKRNGSCKPWNVFHKCVCYHQPNVYFCPPYFRVIWCKLLTLFNIAS